MMTSEQPRLVQSAPMSRDEKHAAMTYARAVLADAQHPELSVLGRVGAAYDGALAVARGVYGLADYSERPDLAMFLHAAEMLGLDDDWRAEADDEANDTILTPDYSAQAKNCPQRPKLPGQSAGRSACTPQPRLISERLSPGRWNDAIGSAVFLSNTERAVREGGGVPTLHKP